ncbi:hypothetical protein E2C01_045522 [Portunus trituberculatus]|uniref:Uncharacterized protein n=1 Tax=Portunus trituberculatus TaxID=210409 RepID=A0A5B7FV69_PORTR|nr:hypothetical protein [Portunus trituberculatus]
MQSYHYNHIIKRQLLYLVYRFTFSFILTSNFADVHATKFDFICDGVTARSQQNPESPECSSNPTKRQNAIIIAKEDHAVNKLQVVKVIKGDPSKAQHRKDPVIIKVSVAPKSEDVDVDIGFNPNMDVDV